MEQTIFSIGHGNKTLEEFLGELKSFDIAYLVDVRTTPYSKWNDAFNQENLRSYLSQNNITYVYMGDSLGGMPKDTSCYTQKGHIDYAAISQKEYFIKGLERIENANKKGLRLAMMCSESDPSKCHRSKLLGRELHKKGIEVSHIVGVGEAKSQQEVLQKLNDGYADTDLFGLTSATSSYSRKSYL